MINNSASPQMGWPQWNWGKDEWWLTAFGAALSLSAILVPLPQDVPFVVRLVIAVLCLTAVFLFRVLQHSANLFRVALRKALFYDHLFELYHEEGEQLARAQETISKFLPGLRAIELEIEKVMYYNNEMYLVFNRKQRVQLAIGCKISVIDKSAGDLMGEFKISEIRKANYIAQASGYVSPVWLGFVRQNETGGEYSSPPNTIAILLSTEEVLWLNKSLTRPKSA